MKKTINLNGVLVQLERIKAIIHDDHENCNFLKIELNKKREFVFNPNVEKWEIQDFDDVINVEYPDNNTAVENYFDIKEIWEKELNRE